MEITEDYNTDKRRARIHKNALKYPLRPTLSLEMFKLGVADDLGATIAILHKKHPSISRFDYRPIVENGGKLF